MCKLKLFMIAAILTVAFSANAGIYLNPYLSYELGAFNNKFGTAAGPLVDQTLTFAVSGTGMGLVAAYSLPAIFYFGIDYSMGSPTVSVSTDPTGSATGGTGSRTTMFAVAGAKLVLLKLWAGMSLSDTIKASDRTYNGNATKVGVALSMIPLFDINLEYIMHTYKGYSSNGVDTTFASDQMFSGASYNSLNLGVSFPLNL